MSVSEQFGDGAQLVDQLGQMISKDGLQDLLAGFNDAGCMISIRRGDAPILEQTSRSMSNHRG